MVDEVARSAMGEGLVLVAVVSGDAAQGKNAQGRCCVGGWILKKKPRLQKIASRTSENKSWEYNGNN
jgi:hypothetical protein